MAQLQVFLGSIRGACGPHIRALEHSAESFNLKIKSKQAFQLGFFFGSHYFKPIFFLSSPLGVKKPHIVKSCLCK